MRLAFLVFFLLALELPDAGAALAAQASPQPAAETTLENLLSFDETAFDWPGAPSSHKPLATALRVKPGFAVSPILPFGECVYVDSHAPEGSEILASF
jgi:hypothetical protein